MKSRFDSFWLGVILGVVVPIIAALMFFSSKCGNNSLAYCLGFFLKYDILPQILSLCVLPNLGVFFLFIWRNHYVSARGVLIATIVCAVSVLGLKIFF